MNLKVEINKKTRAYNTFVKIKLSYEKSAYILHFPVLLQELSNLENTDCIKSLPI